MPRFPRGHSDRSAAGGAAMRTVNVDTTLTAEDRSILITDSSAGAFTITLPPAAQCAYEMISFRKIDSDTSVCTIACGTDCDWSNDGKLNGKDEGAVVWSDGFRWYLICGNTS